MLTFKEYFYVSDSEWLMLFESHFFSNPLSNTMKNKYNDNIDVIKKISSKIKNNDTHSILNDESVDLDINKKLLIINHFKDVNKCKHSNNI
jgi:predicted AlkP superfamily pyrophosphatase or phosphodiesterase